MTITPATIVVASKEQLSTTIDGEVVIAGLQKGNYYALASVGARVWQLVQTPIAVSDVGTIIADEYHVSAERCEADLLELLESMREQGLIEVAHASLG